MDDPTIKTGEYILPLITAFLGLASGVFIEWLRDHRTYEREREARDSTRRYAQSERRNEFQRQTLLDLQDAAMRLMRSNYSLHHADLMSYSECGVQRPRPLNLDNENMLANAQTALLSVRVRDEIVREKLQQLKDKCTAGTVAFPDLSQTRKAMSEAATIFDELNRRIGEVLRTVDNGAI